MTQIKLETGEISLGSPQATVLRDDGSAQFAGGVFTIGTGGDLTIGGGGISLNINSDGNLSTNADISVDGFNAISAEICVLDAKTNATKILRFRKGLLIEVVE
jgi:hypothetical protein